MIKNCQETKTRYHKIWKTDFQNTELKDEYRNVLHVFEILHIVPFTNAKVERLFSKLNSVKTIERNRLGCDCQDLLLRVKEVEPPLEKFNPDVANDMWFSVKVRLLTAGLRQPKRKRE